MNAEVLCIKDVCQRHKNTLATTLAILSDVERISKVFRLRDASFTYPGSHFAFGRKAFDVELGFKCRRKRLATVEHTVGVDRGLNRPAYVAEMLCGEVRIGGGASLGG